MSRIRRWVLASLLAASANAQHAQLAGLHPVRQAGREVAPCSPLGAAQCSTPINVAWDDVGIPLTIPGAWGTANAIQIPIHFRNVPAGYGVRILRVYGDHIAWVHGIVAPGTHAGVLWGYMNTSPGGSANVEFGEDTCFIYHQGAVGSGELVVPFDNDVHVGGLLAGDNILLLQMALFENDTAQPVHQELTTTIVYQFEKVSQ